VRPEEAGAWDAAAEPQRAAGASAVVALLPGAAVERDAAVGPQQAAEAWVAAAVPRPVARDAAEELQQGVAAPAAAEVRLLAALPSGLPSVLVFHRDQALPWPVPQPAARSARAIEKPRIAWP
jgi:hypothetical protein